MDGLWEKANEVNELSYRIHGLANVAELLGEALSDDINSGVAWTLADMIKHYSDRLDKVSEELMAMNRVDVEDKPVKGKKK